MTLKERLTKYFEKRPADWVSSGDIQRLVMNNTKYTARTAVRRLQELTEDNVLERKLVKNHSFYRISGARTPEETARELVELFDKV
jgi:CTP-dependent riboflavin kinase